MPAAKPKVAMTCVMCGATFLVHPSRALRAGAKAPKYCATSCASKGQKLNRSIWNAGKSKADDARLARMAESTRRWYKENPGGRSGVNHPFYGCSHTEEANAKNRAAHAGKSANEAQRAALSVGWRHRTGHTKATLASIANGAAKLSALQKGRKNPQQSAWARAYYLKNPDKHPNRILARRGHETGIERRMRLALEGAGIAFEPQHPAGRYFIDFALPWAMLAIEVDGTYWHTPERDARRDAALQRLGWTVLHFGEDRVTNDIHGCMSDLLQALEQRFHSVDESGKH